jgi:hypothetical protein
LDLESNAASQPAKEDLQSHASSLPEPFSCLIFIRFFEQLARRCALAHPLAREDCQFGLPLPSVKYSFLFQKYLDREFTFLIAGKGIREKGIFKVKFKVDGV